MVAVFMIAPLIVGLATGQEFYRYGMMGGRMMGGFGWFMPLFWLAILGFIIWAVIAATQSLDSTKYQQPMNKESALEIIKGRYARGEINKEEFEEKRKDLIQ